MLELARYLRLDEQETRQLLEASLTALAPHWLVPLPRNPFFTGREEVLETLHAQLGVEQAGMLPCASALCGLGGMGQTQIALEYIYRHALDYSAVFWISAETEGNIVAGLLSIAELILAPEIEDKDQLRVIAAVQRWLNAHGPWLLIWDNIEDLNLLRRFLPTTRSGALLLTTRYQTLGTFARSLDLLPKELFHSAGARLGPTLEGVCSDPLEWDRVVGTACSYLLLSRLPEEQTLSPQAGPGRLARKHE